MNNVKFLREQRGMIQDTFAEFCDIPRISLARYEAGEPIGRKNAQKIAAACHVSVDFVIGIDEPPPAAPVRDAAAELMADLTPEELEQVQNYAAFLKARRKSD